MDEQDILKSLSGFESVWKRVTTAGSSSEDETLKQFIKDEICDAAYYTSLSRMFQGQARNMLLSHASDEKGHARRLQAEYFIRTGESHVPSGPCEPVTGKMASLRVALQHEKAGANAYRKAAEQTASPELREVYSHNAADEERHAMEDRKLILENF
jgi:hypothetical protein